MPIYNNIDGGSEPEILSTPTEDMDERASGCHSRGPSDPRAIPPSPTLSTQPSVYFMASTALQDNKPEGGITSPALISPTEFSASVSGQPSNVIMTNTDDGTIADQSNDRDIKAWDDLPLFPRLRRGRISPILKSRPSRIPNDDRVTP